MQKTLIEQLVEFFPGVIWTAFRTSKGVDSFWEILEEMYNQGKNAKEYLVRFFDYNREHKADQKKETFKLMLPEEELINSIPEEYFKNEKNAFQVILNYEENLFINELAKVLGLSVEDLTKDDEYFMVANKFADWKNWVCCYDKKRYKFKWDSNIDYGLYKYNSKNPFDACIWKCQYAYTLLRIGYEMVRSDLTKRKKMNESLNKIINKFFSASYKMSDTEKINLRGNIDMGIESKKNKPYEENGKKQSVSEYYPKNYEETEYEIKYCIKYKKYEHKEGSIVLSFYDCKTINDIFYEKQKLDEINFSDLGKYSHIEKLKILLKNLDVLSEKEIYKVKRIDEKYRNNFEYSLNTKVSDDEDGEEFGDFIKSDDIVTDDEFLLKESIVQELKNQFSSPSEKEFQKILDGYLKVDGLFNELTDSLNKIFTSEDFSDAELFQKYLHINNLESYSKHKEIQNLFREKILVALNEIREDLN
jgi:hypothetical protein